MGGGSSTSTLATKRVGRDKPILTIFKNNGDISIENSEDILSFEMRLKGRFLMTAYMRDYWSLSYNKKTKTVKCFTTGASIGADPILKYKGRLQVVYCKVHLLNGQTRGAMERDTNPNVWNKKISTWDGISEKFDELKKSNIFASVPPKTMVHWQHKNKMTKGGAFILKNKDYKGPYHIHHNGCVMTGSEYSEESEVLKRSVSNRELRQQINTPVRKAKNIRTIKKSIKGDY